MNNLLNDKNIDKENKNNHSNNEDINNKKEIISELSFLKKVKYAIDKYKIDSKERKIKKEKELAQLELERTRQELERVVELERLAKEKLELEKQQLESRREQAKIRAKQIEEDKLRLEQEALKIQKEQQRRAEEEEKRKKLEEDRKAEQKRLAKERKEQERLRIAEEKRLDEEKLAKEKEEKLKKIEEEIKKEEEEEKESIILKERAEKTRLEEESKDLLKQLNTLEREAENEARETRKVSLETSNNEKENIDAQNNIFKKELQINEEKLKLENLNKINDDDKTKIETEKKRSLISNLLIERQSLLKNLEKRKKELTNEKKTLLREKKIEGFIYDIKKIKQEVIGENEKINEIIDEDGNKRNLLVTIYHTIVYYFSTKVLKKEKKELEYTLKTRQNIKVKIGLSVAIALLMSILFFITLKITLSEKDIYGDNIVKVTENKEENNIINKSSEDNNEKIDSISESALKEEEEAKLTTGAVAYYFPVDRTIKTKEKVHIFNSPNWNDTGEILPENTELNVNLLTSPGGYLMYQITDGKYASKFISANNNLISIEKKNDVEDKFTNKPVAIRILSDVNSYKDENLSTVNASLTPNIILNILGITKNENNRLVYNLTDGTFIPVDASKIIETQRPTITINKENKENQTKQPNNKNRT